MKTGMEITRVDQGGCPELLVAGRMDGYWSRHLEEAIDELMREGIHRTRVNLSKTAYISSAGIRVLVHAFKQFSAVGGELLVVDPSPAVRKVLDMAGVTEMLCMPAARSETAAAPEPVTHYEEEGCSFDIYECHPGAQLACRVAGRPERLASAAFGKEDAELLLLPADVFALGLGAFGESYEACNDRFGEFLSVAGCAAGQPTEETGYADYMVSSGNFVPRVMALYNLCCRGEFARLLRFESNASAGPVRFSRTVAACMAAAGSPAVGIVMVAESAGMLGASLKRSPADGTSPSLFRYPEIRQWLSFSPVRSYSRSVAVIAGVAAQPPAPATLAPLLRPMIADPCLLGHFHAAAFGYRPLRKGYVELEPLVKRQFESGGLQGVLHLLTDDRAGAGTGESEFTRGACWIGSLGRFLSSEETL
jgi:anti-anti-sigma factor